MIGDGAETSVEDGEAVALAARSAKIAAYSKGRRGRSRAIMVMRQDNRRSRVTNGLHR
jgi:hypothetical protein